MHEYFYYFQVFKKRINSTISKESNPNRTNKTKRLFKIIKKYYSKKRSSKLNFKENSFSRLRKIKFKRKKEKSTTKIVKKHK